MRRIPVITTVALLAWGCRATPNSGPTTPFEAISLLGDTLVAPSLSDSLRAAREAQLLAAREELDRDPGSADAWIWVGRREAYLGRYQDALRTYTDALARFSDDPRLYRHRGHRHITVRAFGAAIADFDRAAALVAGRPDDVEPDGLPNARNIPTSTLQFNIWYHLGLAHYLRGDFDNALRAYRECLAVSGNPDALVATSHWLYMTLRRLNRPAEASAVLTGITPELDVIENGSYHRLLLMYRGMLPIDSVMRLDAAGEGSLENVTQAYGVGNWHLYNDRPAEAERIFRAIVGARNQWAAFGYIAAEAELARR